MTVSQGSLPGICIWLYTSYVHLTDACYVTICILQLYVYLFTICYLFIHD